MMVLPGVRPGMCPGPDGWGLPPAPLPYEFPGGMVPCGPQVRAGEVGAWFPSPPRGMGALPGLYMVPGSASRPRRCQKTSGHRERDGAAGQGAEAEEENPGVPTGARGVRHGGCVRKSAEPEDRVPLGGPAAEPHQQKLWPLLKMWLEQSGH